MTFSNIKSFKDFIRWIFFIETKNKTPSKVIDIRKPVTKKTKKKKKKGAKKS